MLLNICGDIKTKNGIEDLKKAKWYLDYVEHDIERDGDHVPDEVYKMYYRLNDLWIDIQDKVSNGGFNYEE